MTRFDSPWKKVLTTMLPDCLQILYPRLHRLIDWTQSATFLDKEFQAVAPKEEGDRRYVDALVKVWLLNGQEQWLLLHIEVQADKDRAFPERMFTYCYRIYDRYKRMPASLAIPADLNPTWRPDRFRRKVCGSRLDYRYHIVKLLDWLPRLDQLERSQNPFSLIIMAHLKAKMSDRQGKQQVADPEETKAALVKLLFAKKCCG